MAGKRLHQLLTNAVIAPLGWLAALIVGDLLRVRRLQVEEAMRRAGIAGPHRTARGMYRALGVGLFELVALALGSGQGLIRRVQFDDPLWATLKDHGFVAAVAHTGNFDLVGCAFAQHFELWVVTKHFRVGILDRLWQGVRRRCGVHLIEQGRVVSEVFPALRRGAAVAMVVDQAPERRRGAVQLPFLGQLAWVDLSPALLALRARVPLVVAFPRRRSDGSQSLDLVRILKPPARVKRGWAEQAMRTVTQDLEGFVREHPEQWLWLHRRWKDCPQE